MNKKIKTIQLSDKKDFDKKINKYLVKGWKILDNSYQIIKKGEIDVYSVVVINEGKFEVSFYENGQKEYFCPLNEYGKRDGLYEKWDEEGEKTREETYKDGVLHGIQKLWLNSSQYWEYHYNNGEKEKSVQYLDGKLDRVCEYKNNVENEYKVTEYYKNGQKHWEEEMRNSVGNGLCIWYYENGQKKLEGIQHNNEDIGKWTYYNEDGSVKEVKEY